MTRSSRSTRASCRSEDDRVARDLLCEILRGEGFEVEAVDDGAGAVERAVAGRYDLVVSDVRMERSGGSGPPEYFATHPSHGTREQQLRAWLPEALPYFEAATPAPDEPLPGVASAATRRRDRC